MSILKPKERQTLLNQSIEKIIRLKGENRKKRIEDNLQALRQSLDPWGIRKNRILSQIDKIDETHTPFQIADAKRSHVVYAIAWEFYNEAPKPKQINSTYILRDVRKEVDKIMGPLKY